jgi:hypothetical protein
LTSTVRIDQKKVKPGTGAGSAAARHHGFHDHANDP